MSELIYKDKLKQCYEGDMRLNGKTPCMADYVSIRKMIDSMPTTTEEKIRNKAINEFAEKLKESLMKNYRHFITTDKDGFDWLTTDAVGTHIDEIAEQLKGE